MVKKIVSIVLLSAILCVSIVGCERMTANGDTISTEQYESNTYKLQFIVPY